VGRLAVGIYLSAPPGATANTRRSLAISAAEPAGSRRLFVRVVYLGRRSDGGRPVRIRPAKRA